MAPDHLKATSQGLLASVLNFSNLTGVLMAGWLYDQIGPVKVFLLLAGICFLGLVIFLGGQIFLRGRRERKKREESDMAL